MTSPNSPSKDFVRASTRLPGAEVRVHLTPRASRDAVAGVREGSLRVRLTSPPVDDAANKHLVKFLSKLIGVPRSSVSVLSGAKSRQKLVGVQGRTRDEVLEALRPHLGT